MKDNLHEDNLENFFHKHLHGYQGEPGAGMWERIEGDLPEKKRRGVVPLWWRWAARGVAAVVILFLGISNYYHQREIGDLAEQLQGSQQDIEELQRHLDKGEGTENNIPAIANRENGDTPIRQNPATTGNGGATNPLTAHSLPSVVAYRPESSSAGSASPASPTGTPPSFPTGSQGGDSHNNRTPLVGTPAPPPSVAEATPSIDKDILQDDPGRETQPVEGEGRSGREGEGVEKGEYGYIAKINRRPAPSPVVVYNGKKNEGLAVSEPKKRTRGYATGWFAGFSVKPEHNLQYCNSSNGAECERLKAEERPLLSYDIGAKVGYNFGKGLAVATGLKYDESGISLQHSGSVSYDSANETQQDETTYASNYPYEATSSFGDIGMEVAMNRGMSTELAEGEELPLYVDAEFKRRRLEIPLEAHYTVGKGNWAFHTRAGLVANLLLSERPEILSVDSDRSSIRYQMTTPASKLSEPSKAFSLGYIAGMGASYSLSSRWALHLEPTVEGFLGRQPALPRTKIYSLGLETGLTYHF